MSKSLTEEESSTYQVTIQQGIMATKQQWPLVEVGERALVDVGQRALVCVGDRSVIDIGERALVPWSPGQLVPFGEITHDPLPAAKPAYQDTIKRGLRATKEQWYDSGMVSSEHVTI